MYTIMNEITNEIVINNSRFITIIYKINSINDVEELINKVKETYKDATHYCYAYIIDDKMKFSDDGEPSGTAGLPMIDILKKKNLNYILAIVVRYFGGIKLGANGLVRAYSKSVSKCLDQTKLLSLEDGYNIDITFSYEDIKTIDYLLKDIKINNKYFEDKIKYNIDIPKDFIEVIKNNSINYQINKEIQIEKRL